MRTAQNPGQPPSEGARALAVAGLQETEEGFAVLERHAGAALGTSIGLANIAAEVPDIEANKAKILRALRVFKAHGVNIALFPEFSLSGYFWDAPECWDYMESAVTERHVGWIDSEVRPLLDETLRVVVMNNITRGPSRKFFNTTFLVAHGSDHDLLDPEFTYRKVFLPGIEKTYTESGRSDRLVVRSPKSDTVVGFTTCYDYLFQDLLREYKYSDGINAVVELASWRGAASRDYPGFNVRSDRYYGELWDVVMSAYSATNQVWTFACNAVGRHPVSGAAFWGGSGIWAPSGMRLVQASHFREELLIVHGLELESALEVEKGDFDYEFDFREVYRPMEDGRSFTREADI
jgi:predicted amidohydrolase